MRRHDGTFFYAQDYDYSRDEENMQEMSMNGPFFRLVEAILKQRKNLLRRHSNEMDVERKDEED